MAVAALAGLDLLATAIVIVDRELVVRFANPAAENLFELSSKSLMGNMITEVFEHDRVLGAAIDYARLNHCSYTEHDLKIGVAGHAKLHLSCTLSPVALISVALGSMAPMPSAERSMPLARKLPVAASIIVTRSGLARCLNPAWYSAS